MSKFKVGDKVRVIKVTGANEKGKYIGLTSKITMDDHFGTYHYRLELDEIYFFEDDELELVQPKQSAKMLNYIGLAHLINGGKQPKHVNLILNTNGKEKVKYVWDEHSECYMIEDRKQEDENYDFYLRDCLLDNQNFERCIEVVEEEPTAKKMTVAEIQKELGYKVEIIE